MGAAAWAVRVSAPGRCSSVSPARETVQDTRTLTCPPGRNASVPVLTARLPQVRCWLASAEEATEVAWAAAVAGSRAS